MAAAPYLRDRDVERLVATYRARLDESGLSSVMSEADLAERTATMRSMLVSMLVSTGTVDEVPDVSGRGAQGGGHRRWSSGSREMFELRPVRDATGRIDVDRSVADARLVREVTTTEVAKRVRLPWWLRVWKPVGWVLTRLFFRDAVEHAARVEAEVDEMVRSGFAQQRADEDGRREGDTDD